VREITIKGNLNEIGFLLTTAKDIVNLIDTHGFALFTPEEQWEYRTRGDTRVCPKCEEFGAQPNLQGPTIPTEFPDRRRLGDESSALFHPEVHITYPIYRGNCRCRVELMNKLATLLFKLDYVMRAALIP